MNSRALPAWVASELSTVFRRLQHCKSWVNGGDKYVGKMANDTSGLLCDTYQCPADYRRAAVLQCSTHTLD